MVAEQFLRGDHRQQRDVGTGRAAGEPGRGPLQRPAIPGVPQLRGQGAGPGHRLHQPAELGLHHHQPAVPRVVVGYPVDHRLGGLEAEQHPAVRPVRVSLGEQPLHRAQGGALPACRRVPDEDREQAGGMLGAAEPGVRLRARRVAEQRQERHQHRGRVGAGGLRQGQGHVARAGPGARRGEAPGAGTRKAAAPQLVRSSRSPSFAIVTAAHVPVFPRRCAFPSSCRPCPGPVNLSLRIPVLPETSPALTRCDGAEVDDGRGDRLQRADRRPALAAAVAAERGAVAGESGSGCPRRRAGVWSGHRHPSA